MSVTTVLQILFDLLFPLAFGLWFTTRYRTDCFLLAAGALAFIASQVVLIPVVYALTVLFQNRVLPAPPPGWEILFNAAVLGLLAGLCEETARWTAYRLLRDRASAWPQGVALGLGYGGMECVFVGVAVLATFVSMSTLGQLAPQNYPAGVNPAQAAAYWATPWAMPLVGVFERLASLAMQVSLSVLVLQSFLRRAPAFFWLVVLWHAFSNGAAAALPALGASLLTTEFCFGLLALINLAVVFRFRGAAAGYANS